VADAREIQSTPALHRWSTCSGKHRWVHARWHCPKFLRQTFHEFALASILSQTGQRPSTVNSETEAPVTRSRPVPRLSMDAHPLPLLEDSDTYDDALFLTQLRLKKSPIIRALPLDLAPQMAEPPKRAKRRRTSKDPLSIGDPFGNHRTYVGGPSTALRHFVSFAGSG